MNRTSEFKSAVEKARLRLAQNGGVPEHKQRLLGSASGSGAGGKQASKRSEFARSAGQIAKEIQGTMGKLEKLAQRELPPRDGHYRCRVGSAVVAWLMRRVLAFRAHAPSRETQDAIR